MIQDVDASLREMVRREVVNGSDVEVAFDAPTSDWAARQNAPTLDVYLYDIREDTRWRTAGSISQRSPDGFVSGSREPPRYFKLSYLVTAWTQRPEDEHRLLSAVLGTFIRSDALPPDVLQGLLAEQGLPVMVTVALPPPQDRSISDVWSALGGELKASIDLCVIAPFDTDRFFAAGPPVLEELKLRFRDDDGLDEEATGSKKKGKKGEVDEDEPAGPPLASEELWGGAEVGQGRRFRINEMPRKR